MTTLFAAMADKAKAKKITEVADKVPTAGGWKTLETDIYPAVVKIAFLTPSASSAAVKATVEFDVTGPDGKVVTHREHQWIANKEGELTKYDEKSNKTVLNHGAAWLDGLCKVAAGLRLEDCQAEVRSVKLHDGIAQREVLIELTNTKVLVGMLQIRENRTSYDKDTNSTVVHNEPRMINKISNVFCEDSGQSPTELVGQHEAKLINAWREALAGKMQDKYKEQTNQPKPMAVNRNQPQVAAQPVKAGSLFAKL